MGRAAALLGLALAFSAYSFAVPRFADVPARADLALLALVVFPGVFLLVWLGRSGWRAASVPLAATALGFGTLAVLFELADVGPAASLSKLAAVTAVGWWFLRFFDAAAWVVLVALLIVPVDIFSVERGPTRVIVEERPEVFELLSLEFLLPGADGARLGLPDVLFFALFLGAAERFRLRPGATWVAMVASFGATMALAIWLEVGGLAALPLLSAAFVLTNGDRLWREFRRTRSARADS